MVRLGVSLRGNYLVPRRISKCLNIAVHCAEFHAGFVSLGDLRRSGRNLRALCVVGGELKCLRSKNNKTRAVSVNEAFDCVLMLVGGKRFRKFFAMFANLM